MDNLISTINYIVSRSAELRNQLADASSAPVEFACIFCQNEKEYEEFTNAIGKLGKVAERTQNGFTYLLDKPIETIAGSLRLVKIRKPDPNRPERGDADFNANYDEFKKKYQNNFKFELIERNAFEMLRLEVSYFDLLVGCFNIPKSKNLGIKP